MSSSGAKNGIAYFQAFSGKLAQRSPHLQRPSFTHGQSLGILFCRMPRLSRPSAGAVASALPPSLPPSFDAKMLQLKRRIFARNVIGLLHALAIAEFRTQPGSCPYISAVQVGESQDENNVKIGFVYKVEQILENDLL